MRVHARRQAHVEAPLDQGMELAIDLQEVHLARVCQRPLDLFERVCEDVQHEACEH